jgi:protein SCO1/2
MYRLLALLALASTGCARHYRVDGMLLRLDPPATMTVSHRDIRGYMPAMVMPFRAAHPAELRGLHPGSLVAFDLAVRHGSLRAEHIRSRGEKPEFALPAAAARLRPGDLVPGFTLLDDSGRPRSLAELRGKVVALDFLYTRCPLPAVCPRLAANFARLQRRFAADLGTRVVLLSITIDPQYDRPAVLARYAKLWKANPEGWHFLTGGMPEIRAIAERFGVIYWPEDGILSHSTETAIIAPDGRLAALVDGPNYAAYQLGDLIALQLKEPPGN